MSNQEGKIEKQAAGSLELDVRPEVWSRLTPNESASVNVWIWLGIAGLAAALLTGCGTVAPKPVESHQPSFLGSTNADSGILSLREDHSALITDAVRIRYNHLIDRYGKRFDLPLTFDAGIKPEGQAVVTGGSKVWMGTVTWRIDAEHLADYLIMIQWQRDGK